MLKDKLAFTKSTWYGYLIITLNVVVAILIIFLLINIHNLEQYKPITNFQFEESEWIKINSANVYTQGKQVVTPNDQLLVIFNVTNKVSKNILIEPEFHTYQAGQLKEIKPISSVVYGFKNTGIIDGVYFPTFEGLNIVEVAFKISYSNGTFLTYQNATTGFNVISKTDELQIQQNDYILWGFFASTLIGAGTLTVLYFTQRTSNRQISKMDDQLSKMDIQNSLLEKQIDLLKTQNEDLKEQQSIQNRPWISLIAEHPVTLHEGLFQIQFENFGNSVATNVVTTSRIKKGEITKEDLIKNGITYPEFDISPKESFSHILPIPEEIQKIIDTDNDIHIGIIIKYKFEQTKEGECIIIARWEKSIKKSMYEIKKLT